MSATVIPFPTEKRTDVGQCPDCFGIVPVGFTFVIASEAADVAVGVEVEEVSYACPHCGAGITVELTRLPENEDP